MLQVGKTLAYEVVSTSYLENDVRIMNPKTMVSHALNNYDVSDPQIMLERFSGNRRLVPRNLLTRHCTDM